jgi:methyl-accepting chemotaxis protein
MNLTVAKKIIGGFAILSLLLVLTSVISLWNLNKINTSTLKQNELAIPTLKGSNDLATGLVEIGGYTLKAYYQKNAATLQKFNDDYKELNTKFASDLTKLKSIVKNEAKLLSNLQKVEGLYETLQANVESVFKRRLDSINLTQELSDKIDIIEERADDAATLMLDLGDHELADTALKGAIDIGYNIETIFNDIVTLAYEYRESLDEQSLKFIAGDINNALDDMSVAIEDISVILISNDVTDVSDSLKTTQNELNDYMNGPNSIVLIKKAQIEALNITTDKLASAELDIKASNDVLNTQVILANETTKQTADLVEDSVSNGSIQTTIIMVVSLLSAIVIAFFTLKSITVPLRRVNEMLNFVAAGDLSRNLAIQGKDEFAELSKNCNTVIESLRTLIESIVSRSGQLAAAAEETSAITAQSTVAIEEQRSQVEQAASATTEMSSTSQSVLSSANDALGEIKQADDEAERVKVISEKNKETIELLANEVESASQVINQLQQDSASIGGILDVIRGIAEQTNLLALNAAIEAARAGEQGRGFAVVADEVRTLASRTQESTQEIQKMIVALQSGAEKAVSVMETGKSQAADCVTQTELANTALDTITHAVHEAYDRSSQIATAAEEQSVVAHEISENLESIVAIAEETTSGAKQTADSSSEVARLSEELQQSVQEFKL